MATLNLSTDRQLYDALYRLVNQEATVTCKTGFIYTGKMLSPKWNRGSSDQPNYTLCCSLGDLGYKYIPLADIVSVEIHG